jgi:formamidopyrimidine-DNA glycosylase
MPELPEVETIVRQLAPALRGQRILKARVVRRDVLRESPTRFRGTVAGAEVRSVTRRGKNIVLSLSASSTSRFLVVNLGMTGQLLLRCHPRRPARPTHVAVVFSLDSGDSLLYADSRRFGRLALFTAEEWKAESERLGPEPLSPGLTPWTFHHGLAGSRSPVRSWLLDQTRLAGVGNIYACEALHRAGIHPVRTGASLEPADSARLLMALREVLREAIEARGTTLRDYRTASGEEGGFVAFLRAYGREGESCPRCGTPIVRIVFSNRSAFLCPRCQPEAPGGGP